MVDMTPINVLVRKNKTVIIGRGPKRQSSGETVFDSVIVKKLCVEGCGAVI